jgi:excisionase family DNA binding protein
MEVGTYTMATAMLPRAHSLDGELNLGQEPVRAEASDHELLDGIETLLRQRRPKLVGANGEQIELPEPIFRLLCQIVPHLKKGHALSLVPVHQELSTQQAADLLNVSRPFLIGLLERGELPYVKTGKHRRIRFGDLMAFKRRRDATRRQALGRLTEMSQEMGLDVYQD